MTRVPYRRVAAASTRLRVHHVQTTADRGNGRRPRRMPRDFVSEHRRPPGGRAERYTTDVISAIVSREGGRLPDETAEGGGVKTDDVRDHFRVQVPAYPALMQRLIPHYDLQRDVMVSLMPADRRRPLRILDLGCGPGVLASRLLDEYPRATLTLFDLTEEMIDVCRSRLGQGSRVAFAVGDFRTDDVGEGYDVIVASRSLHHAPLDERPALAARLLHSLAPGGQLITAEVVVDDSLAIRDRQYELWRRFMAAQGEDGEAWYQKHLAKDHPVMASAWLRLLTERGFAPAGCFWRYLNFAIFSGWRPVI